MQILSYPTETVLCNKITRNRIVLSFKDCPRKPLRRRGNKPLLLLLEDLPRKAIDVVTDSSALGKRKEDPLRNVRLGYLFRPMVQMVYVGVVLVG